MKVLVPERSDNFMSYNGQMSNSIPSSPSPFLYAGQLYDRASGLYYLRARWYDPKTAQFLSVDPLVSKTLQPYEYAGDDPVNGGDPTGMCNCAVLASAAQAFLGISVFNTLSLSGALTSLSFDILAAIPALLGFPSVSLPLRFLFVAATILEVETLSRMAETCG